MNRLLIVDDESLIRSSLQKVISSLSELYLVSGMATNGLDALEWLEHHYADMCITDVRMPKMDGLELIRIINERYPWMSCVVVSSYDDFGYIKECMKLGTVDYVLKPVDRKMLNEAINKSYHLMMNSRNDFASRLILRKLPHDQAMLFRWVEQIRTIQHQSMPILIVDTLEMLERWLGNTNLHYLNSLCMAWLRLVSEELSKDDLNIVYDEGKDLSLGEATLPHDKKRGYFRLCAVRRLEEGAELFIEASMASKDQPSRKTIDGVKRYINEHFASKITLQDLADHVSVSRNYIAVLFKKTTGDTIWNYLISVRMSKAREYLLHTPMKIYEIANEVGYDNSIYFSQLFKEYFGLSPSEYKSTMES